MGLDYVVESAAKPSHEEEWSRILRKAFSDADVSDAETERFKEISIPAYERVGAPRVGYDKAADDWIVKERKAVAPEEIEKVLREFHGHYALPLVTSDGLPKYSHANLYDGVDETSLRGNFLTACTTVLSSDLIDAAWDHRFPEQAVDYGRKLLAAADAFNPELAPPAPAPKRGLLARLGLTKSQRAAEFTPEEELDIVQTSGRWFVFWGERGHAIRVWV